MNHLFHRLATAALTLSAPVPAFAQTGSPAPSTHARAIAAGYKAAMLCSAILNARAMGGTRSAASVEAHELRGIYPEYQALVAALPAMIGRDRVAVRFDLALPPRVAVSTGHGGCTNLPVGANPAAALPIIARTDERRASVWPAGDPAAITPPPAPIAPLFQRALAGGYGGNTTAVLVVQRGRLIGEGYAEGFGPFVPQRTWSVAKSIAGTLIGAAAQRGLINPLAPAPIPEWQRVGDPRRGITVDHLLRMASGLHSDTAGNRTDALYFGGTAVTEETVGWGLDAVPGTRFRYANNDTLLAVRALRARVGRDDFAHGLLFAPIGAYRTIAERDWQGNYVLSSQVWATARDLARFGQLWLDDGVWQGNRILPAGWMRHMTTPRGPQPARGPGYGATLWLYGPAIGLPAGSFAAQGNRGQFIFVVPSAGLVVVRRGEDPGGGGFDAPKFVADIIAALAPRP